MMWYMLQPSPEGKLPLQNWYLAKSDKQRKKMVRELMPVILTCKPKMCSFLQWRDLTVTYKRCASLYFCCAVECPDYELITLQRTHGYVELLEEHSHCMCKLDTLSSFEKAHFVLHEFLMGGDVQDTFNKCVLKAVEQGDLLQEEDESPARVLAEMSLVEHPGPGGGDVGSWWKGGT